MSGVPPGHAVIDNVTSGAWPAGYDRWSGVEAVHAWRERSRGEHERCADEQRRADAVGVGDDAAATPFAGLAVLALLDGDAGPDGLALLAAAAALLGATRRSLGLTLACGLAGFAVG